MKYPDYLFIANREGKLVNERVQNTWPYSWKAVYDDGTVLMQFTDDENTQDDKGNTYKGKFHQIAEIDQSKLILFTFFNIVNGKKVDIRFNPQTMKLMCFYQKGRQYIYTNEKEGEGHFYYYTISCVGWEKNIGGETVKTVMKILPDDTVVASDDKDLKIEFS